MSATTTAIWVIVIGTGGATMRPPLLPDMCYLLDRGRDGVLQCVCHLREVAGRAAAVEDRAAADDHVGAPAGDLGGVGDGDAAVHAHQDVGAAAGGQLTDGVEAAASTRRGRLAGPAGVDGEHQD